LLKNKVFDEIRNPEMEAPAPYQIKLDVDKAGDFDYENLHSKKLDSWKYLETLWEEMEIVTTMNQKELVKA